MYRAPSLAGDDDFLRTSKIMKRRKKKKPIEDDVNDDFVDPPSCNSGSVNLTISNKVCIF